jgi:hypothetical protein
MEQLYTNQLRIVLQLCYTNKMSDIQDLCGALFQIENKSRDGKYKAITMREIKKRLRIIDAEN